MHLRNLVLATLAVSGLALAQSTTVAPAVGPVSLDAPFQVNYASNLNLGDSVINITNTGAAGAGLAAGSQTGALCANVYAFSPDEQLISCCSCNVTANGLVSLSATRDLISNTLTPAVPTSIVVKILATTAAAGCNAATPGAPQNGLVAWGTTIHAAATLPGGLATTERAFVPATLSAGELTRLTALCGFIQANGSGFGICRSCRLGGLGATKL
jgi:hypothetical protein